MEAAVGYGHTFQHLQFLLQDCSVNIREQFEQWLGSSNELSIFISGRTGGGKSTLVNALLGAKLAEEGAEPDPTTATVASYERLVSGVRVSVWDSPGLQDGTQNEERYLNDIATKCTPIDLFLFCINVADATRFNMDSPDVKALAKLTEKLSPSIWNNAIITLTFANRLGQKSEDMRRAKQRKDWVRLKELFCDKVVQWQEFLRDILRQIGLSPAQVSALKIVPTGHPRGDPSLPDRPHWLSTFWFEALRSTHPRAQPALLRMNETRLVENPETVDEKIESQHSEDQKYIFSDFGGDVGSFLYGSKNFGEMVGLDMAKCKNLDLVDRIKIEQFCIMEIAKDQQQDPWKSGPPAGSRSQSESPAACQENQSQVEGEKHDPEAQAECGGPFY